MGTRRKKNAFYSKPPTLRAAAQAARTLYRLYTCSIGGITPAPATDCSTESQMPPEEARPRRVKATQLDPSGLGWRMLLLALAYFLAGQASLSLSVSHGIITMVVFTAEGLALAAAILWGPRIWPGVFLGQFALAASQELSWSLAASIAATNSLEALLGAWLFRQLDISPALHRLRDIGWLVLLIAAVLQPFSATCGSLLLWLDGSLQQGALPSAWMAWWAGNTLGQLMVTPMVLALASLQAGRHTAGRILAPPLALALLSSLLLLIIQPLDNVPLGLSIAEPLMIVIAARYRLAGATLATLVQALLLLYLTQLGLGPFANDASPAAMNVFLLRLALIGQFIAVLFSERHADELQLRLNSDQLNQAQRIAHLGSWSMDLITKSATWSAEVYRILELDPAQDPPSHASFIKRVHPDDLEEIHSAFRKALQQGHTYECNHRLRFADGRLKHVRARGEIHYARDGTPLRFVGTMLDTTQLHEAQERLHLYAYIFDQSSEAIVITNPDNDIVAVNPAFSQLTGYTPDDVIGHNPRLLASGKTPAETHAELWQSLHAHGHWHGELWDRRKDGSIYPKWASISVIRNASGQLINYVASFVDIAERKAAEEHINHLAHHDALTGLHNRLSLQLRLQQALLSAQRNGEQLAVLFFDMDHFKHINDTLGHHIGDLLLIETAQRLSASARASDIIARLGGDEFVMVLTTLHAPAQDAVSTLAGNLSARLAQPYLLDGHSVQSSASIGIALYPADGVDLDCLMRHADAAMYHAKQESRMGHGRGYRFHTPALNA